MKKMTNEEMKGTNGGRHVVGTQPNQKAPKQQGRSRKITTGGKGVHKRGKGLGIGPVGQR